MRHSALLRVLALLPLLLYPCGHTQAEDAAVSTAMVHRPPNAPRTDNSAAPTAPALVCAPVTLRDRGSALTMELPPMGEPFTGYRLKTGERIFINLHFSNGDAHLPLEVIITHVPASADTRLRSVPIPAFGMLTGAPVQGDDEAAAARFREAADATIAAYRAAPELQRLDILRSEALMQSGMPAHRLTVQTDTSERRATEERMWLSYPSGEWFVWLVFAQDEKSLSDDAYRLSSSIVISEASEK